MRRATAGIAHADVLRTLDARGNRRRMFRIVRDEEDWLTIAERNRRETEKHYADTYDLVSRYKIDGKPLRDYIGSITVVKYTALLDA